MQQKNEKSNSRSYNQNYSNRNYSNRNYSNRNYSNRKYNNRNYRNSNYQQQQQPTNIVVKNNGGGNGGKWFKRLFILAILVAGIATAGQFMGGVGKMLNPINWFTNENTVTRVDVAEGVNGVVNGGLTREQITAQVEDDDTPYNEDVLVDLIVRETPDYVLIFKKTIENNVEKYPNLAFVKTARGLVWDGVWGIEMPVPVNNWFTGTHDWQSYPDDNTSSWPVKLNLNSDVAYLKTGGWWLGAGHTNENVVSFSNFRTSFAPDFLASGPGRLWQLPEGDVLFNKVKKYLTSEVLVKYFANFEKRPDGNVETFFGKDYPDADALSQVNSFANYVYKNGRTENKTEKTTVQDISNYFIHFISESLKNNYPISAEKLEMHKPEKFYGIYKNKIIANVNYYFVDNQPSVSKGDRKEIDKNSETQLVAPVVPAKTARLLTVNLKNINSADISKIDLVKKPIIVNFSNSKKLTINSFEKLNQTLIVALEDEKTIEYSIVSEDLIFTAKTGTINVPSERSQVNFNYSYFGGSINVEFKLTPLTTIDTSKIDITNFPVTIILTNSSGRVSSVVFSTTTQLQNGVSRLLEQGKYTYTITSAYLKFSEEGKGELTVSENNKNQLFTFWVGAEVNNLVVNRVNLLAGGVSGKPAGTISINDTIYNNIRLASLLKIEFYNSSNRLIDLSTVSPSSGFAYSDKPLTSDTAKIRIVAVYQNSTIVSSFIDMSGAEVLRVGAVSIDLNYSALTNVMRG